jgi:hypothetical protein
MTKGDVTCRECGAGFRRIEPRNDGSVCVAAGCNRPACHEGDPAKIDPDQGEFRRACSPASKPDEGVGPMPTDALLLPLAA